jgi:CubicO group peptidase (beta-lactamase class C family)
MKKHMQRTLLGLALLACTPAAFATPSVGDDIDRLVDQTMARYDLPGMAVGVIQDGRVVHLATRGQLAVDAPEMVDADTLFKIASNTKAMTAAVLARLVQAGKLRWDDPVIKHLPQFAMHDPWVTQNMQVRDLLIHNSGLGLGAGDLMLWPEPNQFDRAAIIAGLAHLKPVTSFRAGYAYDNLLYVVAGEVAAAAAGKPFNQLLREEIFTPLGMTRCQAGDWSPSAVGNVAQPHYRNASGNVVGRRDGDWEADFPSMAAGGVRCSLNDMLRWSQVLLDPSLVPGWLEADQRRALWTAHMPMPISTRLRDWDNTHFLAYGYGWRLSDMDGQWKVAHTGTLSGMYSSLALLPDRRNAAVILINGEGEAARTTLMQALLKRWTAPAAGLDVDHYADRLDAERGAQVAAGRVRPDTSAARAVPPAQVAAQGLYRDPWFGQVSLCPAGDTLQWAAARSPRMLATVKQLGGRLLLDWHHLGEDADAWLQLDGQGGAATMQLSAIDPDIDFSYDYPDLRFERVADCPFVR